MTGVASGEPLTLDNCDLEPIHIPGLVQSHGALIAFDGNGIVSHVSANARELMGADAPALGSGVYASSFAGHPGVEATLHAAADGRAGEGEYGSSELRLNGRDFDLVAHRYADKTIAELERRPDHPRHLDRFTTVAHRSMERLKHQPSIEGLLAMAVVSVRQLTGFDRVMAYRFRDDDSGEVAAEDRIETLGPFLGLRYPASDIPAQARRLYVLNTLRLIADVDSVPVALVAANLALPPLDMSHCVLRSVSPIHLEYLRNIGVAASMSISIVVDGRLWGMLACHHGSPFQVPYAVRMACDMFVQVLAANLQGVLTRERLLETARTTALRGQVVEAVRHADEFAAALGSLAPMIAEAFAADAVVVAGDDKLVVHGDLSQASAAHITGWLGQRETQPHEIVIAGSLDEMPDGMPHEPARWCGFLAMRYDALSAGWLVLLRKEQVVSIRWGGEPRTPYSGGPLGPRLTPQGSAAVLEETVRGTCRRWTLAQRDLAGQLVDELARAVAVRVTELNRARSQLLAMLGNDLRDPLQSIAMAATVLTRDKGATAPGGDIIAQRIQSSSSRMSRLLDQVLDASRLQTGLGLRLALQPVALTQLLEDLLDESRIAYPDVRITQELEAGVVAMADADRMAQLVTNLVGNARHHGVTGEPVYVQLSQQTGEVFIEVSNLAPAIDAKLVPHLFTAYQRAPGAGARNPSGLGLGLHIAQAVARAHHGHIEYRHAEPYVVFMLRFPVGAVAAPARAMRQTIS